MKIAVVFLALLCWGLPGLGGGPVYSYLGGFSGRFAERTHDPKDLASERFDLNLEQKAEISSNWKGVLGLSAWDESVYASEPDRYPERLAREDSGELRLRNAYLQYQATHFFVRAGNQQVVWGEAFGFFFSDIVNPKDLRDGGFGDLSDIRLQTPMLNTKLIFDDFSLQVLAIPQPNFNLLPGPGSDYAFPYKTFLPGQTVQIRREKSLPVTSKNFEWGARLSGMLGHWDLSLFSLSSYDRNPYYELSDEAPNPQTTILQERHARIQSYGLTATNDFGGFVFRAEGLFVKNRVVPLVTDAGLSQAQLNNSIYVLGLDLPAWRKWNIGWQWSEDSLSDQPPGLLRTAKQSLLSLRVQRPFFRNHSLEMISSMSVSDAGQRTQFEYMIPISGSLETRYGAELLDGPASSDFGKIRDAQRVYVLLKYFLKG